MVGEQIEVAKDEQGFCPHAIRCLAGAEQRLERTDRLRQGSGCPPEVERGGELQSCIQVGFIFEAIFKSRADIACLRVQPIKQRQ